MKSQEQAVEKLTAAELNRRIAELLGWTRIDMNYGVPPEYEYSGNWKWVPNYCGNLLDAWSLTEQVAKNGSHDETARWSTYWDFFSPYMRLSAIVTECRAEEAARELARAFLYAMTGTRVELVSEEPAPVAVGQDGGAE